MPKSILPLLAIGVLLAVGLNGAETLKRTPEQATTTQSDPADANVAAIMFTPPEGWKTADPKILPPSVKVMVVGPGSKGYPPSINLGIEEYAGTLKEYLKIVKAINDSQNAEWKNLGPIHTEAGKANLSQVDITSSHGAVRLMHVILVKGGKTYIMTAAALRDEFPRFYNEFFKSMRSLRFGDVSPDQLTPAQYEAQSMTTQEKN